MNKKNKLLLNIILPVLAVIAMNFLVFTLHWNSRSSHSSNWLNPPGELIGAVWVGLFILMGIARYKVQQSKYPDASRFASLIIYYMLFCLSYPLYTLGLKSQVIGVIGNIVTFVFAAYLIVSVRKISSIAAWCLAPVLPWLMYATVTILG